MVKLIEDNYDSEAFNDAAIHPMQSWEWGEARKEMKVDVVRIGEFQSEKLKNVFQMTLHKIPGYRIGYIPRSVTPSQEIVDFLLHYAKKNKILFIKFEPYDRKGSSVNQLLKRSPHSLFPDWTQIVDLRGSEGELLKRMKSKTRYNVRLAEKKGVEIREMSDAEGFEIFTKLYFETTKRQKYFGHDLAYHRAIFENLKNKIAHLLIAFYNSTPVAAYQLFIFKDVGFYTYGGSSDQYRNTMAANLLMWESIRLAKNKGAKKFDMWGSLPPNYDQSHSWAGFTRFKEGYGGEFVEFVGSYDLVTNNSLYQVYNSVYKLREFYLKLRA